jgi:hypothetical protein
MAELNLSETIALLDQTPNKVRGLTFNLERGSQTWKPSPEEFSILENVCHLCDIEAEGYTIRIQKILTEELPALPDLDGASLAMERQYNSRDLVVALEEFRIARTRSLELLQGINEEKLLRCGNLETVGVITLADLLARMLEHDRDHIEELEKLRMSLV